MGRPVHSDPAVVIAASHLSRTYVRGAEEIHALEDVSFTVESGEFVAVVGPSGAGKTTLLNLIGCLDVPTSGTLQIAGREVQNLSDRELTRVRQKDLGFVFQQFALLPTLTVAENVALPAVFAGHRDETRVRELLAKTGLAHRASHRPHELSGGEMQRVAIARALLNRPKILLADEPTGNLDSVTGAQMIELFGQLNREGLTVVVITHNAALAEAADRQIEIRDGRITLSS